MTAAAVTYGPVRAQSNGRRADCSFCKTTTNAEIEVLGPRGAHLRWIPCCWECGQHPSRREARAA